MRVQFSSVQLRRTGLMCKHMELLMMMMMTIILCSAAQHNDSFEKKKKTSMINQKLAIVLSVNCSNDSERGAKRIKSQILIRTIQRNKVESLDENCASLVE